MKFKYILFILLSALLSIQMFSAPKLVKQIQEMDSDNDGIVTLEEFNSNTLLRFKYMDDNGDGILSEAEFLLPSISRFKKMDLNADGKLKKKEIFKALKQNRDKGRVDKKRVDKKQPKPFIKH